jgi:hypothetical protein
MVDKVQAKYWGSQMDAVMSEIAREASICDVRLLDPGVIEAVLANNPSVCGKDNPKAFKKLRDLVMMGFVVQQKAAERMDPADVEVIRTAIRERLQARTHGRLGGS